MRTYKINPQTDDFSLFEGGFKWYSWRSNTPKHLYLGMWYRIVHGYRGRFCTEMACGKRYSSYPNWQQAYNMKDIQSFCPECLKRYHKLRFSGGS